MIFKLMTRTKELKKQARARRVRVKVKQKANGLPRLSVYKSNTRLIAQIIDDNKAHTIAYATSTDKDIKGANATERAVALAQKLSKKALDAGVDKVVFDRGASAYAGKIKAFADAARESGLKF